LGYTLLSDEKNINVKTNYPIHFGDVGKYQTCFYNIEKYQYQIIPISCGLEYLFGGEKFRPCISFEAGFNSFSTNVITGPKYYGIAGTYDSVEQIPSDYTAKPPAVFKGNSLRLAFGIGLEYKVFKDLTFISRYYYQVNTSLRNNHIILLGIGI
jgi:hypothetical protein